MIPHATFDEPCYPNKTWNVLLVKHYLTNIDMGHYLFQFLGIDEI